MKKIILIVLCAMVVTIASAQHEGAKVDFKTIKIEEAIRLAKEKGLNVFCNFSTSWCSPCKTLFSEVYSDVEVGDFMNENFVSIYIDAEAKEWVETAEKYKITGYPTMLIISSEGVEKHRMSGSMSKESFITEVKRSLDGNRSPEALKRRYEGGERTPGLIYDYAFMTMKTGDEKSGYEIVNGYFNSLSDDEKILKENWFLYDTFALSLDDSKTDYVIHNYNRFYKNNDKKEVDKFIYSRARLAMLSYVSDYHFKEKTFNQAEFDKTVRLVSNLEIEQKPQLISILNIAKARVKCQLNEGDNYSSYLSACEKEFNRLDKNNSALVAMNFSSLSLLASDKTKMRAIDLIKKHQSKYEPDGVKGIDIMAKTIASLKPVKRGDAIDFKDISFEEALKIAKQKGKFVFIDCYTTWCGPCKQLASEVFTATIVKKYFDKNFINLKIDMEKGEGIELAKRFQIKGYPTTLLLNDKGEIIHSKIGGDTVENFINEFTKANEEYKSK